MVIKWLHFVLAGIFFLFAFVQLNDPDPYGWFIMYVLVGMIPMFYVLNKLHRKFLRIIIITLVFTFLLYIPPIFQWLTNGMPAIIGTPESANPMMETIRESFGLLLSSIVAIAYYRQINKPQNP